MHLLFLKQNLLLKEKNKLIIKGLSIGILTEEDKAEVKTVILQLILF